jgi:hypothetical protein
LAASHAAESTFDRAGRATSPRGRLSPRGGPRDLPRLALARLRGNADIQTMHYAP